MTCCMWFGYDWVLILLQILLPLAAFVLGMFGWKKTKAFFMKIFKIKKKEVEVVVE